MERSEATFIGELISAINRVEEIEDQLALCNQFTPAMIIRLALVEDKVNPLFERSQVLFSRTAVDTETRVEDLNLKQNDAYMATILSGVDLRIDLLRLRLAIQEGAGYMKYSAKRLLEKADLYKELLTEIAGNPERVKAVARELKDSGKDLPAYQRIMPKWLGGGREDAIEAKKKARALKRLAHGEEENFKRELEEAQVLMESISRDPAVSRKMNLIYWKDGLGEHSYYTDDFELLPVGRGV